MPTRPSALAGAPEPIPTICPSVGEIVPQKLGEISIYFYCGITNQQRDLIAEYVRYALDAQPPSVALKADVYVLDDRQQAAGARFRWLVEHGYPESYQDILSTIGSECGEAEQGALFLYLTRDCWYDGSDYPNGELILHEMHHLLQLELSGAFHYDLPVWLEEGGAGFFAWEQQDTFAGMRVPMAAPSPACNYRLADLEVWGDSSKTTCFYSEGQRAVAWLIGSYGVESYYQMFRQHGTGRSFDDLFLETYNISTANFYRLFDQYRKSGYTVAPALPTLATPGIP